MRETPKFDLGKYWAPAHSKGYIGAGVTVAVVDTGAGDENYQYSSNLNNQAKKYAGADVSWGRIDKKWPPGNVSEEQRRHGWQVFRRMLTGAPGSFYLDFRVAMPEIAEDQFLKALESAVTLGADVINLSLGRLVPHMEAEEHIQSCCVCKFVGQLSKHDVLVLAAAGNFANQGFACPGVHPDVLSIGSTLTPDESAFYKKHPEQEKKDFFEGRSSTSYATAMTSTTHAVLRSAFPAISATDWFSFIRSNRAVSGETLFSYDTPDAVIAELREICGGWSANSTDWKEFAKGGAKTRRELLALANGTGVPGYAELAEWLPMQRDRFRTLIDGQLAVIEARQYSGDIDLLPKAIEHFQAAVSSFEQLSQNARTAAARTWLGAALVNRAWKSMPGQIIMNDALEAEKQLTAACNELQKLEPRKRDLEGSALVWRARARTVLAAMEPALNKGALADAQKAVDLLSAEPQSNSIQHDLALAQLHLARAHYYNLWLARKSGKRSSEDAARVRKHAARALELGPDDGYVQADGKWLIANAG